MSSKNRKVYQMGDMSIREFFSAPTRYLAESTNKESEFEKPYLDEDRGKMHADFPWPDWPSVPSLPPFPPLPPIEGPIPGLSACGITCYEPRDCDEPVWCHPSIWCGTDMMYNLCSWTVEGAVAGYAPHPFGGSKNSFWGIDISINSDLVEEGGEALVHVQMKDPCGNLCGKDVEVTCKVCPPDISISWVSDPNLTIGQGNGGYALAGIEVQDGLSPYKWEVTGTGFSLLYAETAGVSNTLQADATACGMATITVTDDCDETCTGYVRCGEGLWVEKAKCGPCPSGTIWNSSCASCGIVEKEFISGYQRWLVAQQYEYYPNTRTMYWGKYSSACVDACGGPDPPCGDPIQCGDGTPCTAQYSCFAVISTYYEWECAP